MPDTTIIIIAVAVLVVGLGALGGILDLAFLGIAVRAWGFGPTRSLPRKNDKAVLHHRFGKMDPFILGPLVGWILNPWEIIVTRRRFIANYRNAFNRLDIPLDSIASVTVKPRPWPFADEILIGYNHSGTPKVFFMFDNGPKIVDALRRAGANFDLN